MREPDDWNDARGAEAYAEAVRDGRLYRSLARRLVDLAAPRPSELWIDLACGTGALSQRIVAKAGPAVRVAGVDRSPAMLAVARREVPLETVAFVRADPAALPFEGGTADGLVCSAAFWHFPAPRRAWREAARVVRPGGRVAINAPVSQLEGEKDAPASPLQLQLAEVGRRLFGTPPATAGPTRPRADILQEAEEAGLRVADERVVDLRVAQEELVGLLHVPAIGARMYPAARRANREAWIDEAARRVELSEDVPVRWWLVRLDRTEGSSRG